MPLKRKPGSLLETVPIICCFGFSLNLELNLSPIKQIVNETPICIHFQNILTITVVIVLYSSYIGENIAAEAEARVSPGNGSHRLLLWLTASRAAGIAARFGARCQQQQCTVLQSSQSSSLLHGSSHLVPLAIAAAWEPNLWPMEHSTLHWLLY